MRASLSVVRAEPLRIHRDLARDPAPDRVAVLASIRTAGLHCRALRGRGCISRRPYLLSFAVRQPLSVSLLGFLANRACRHPPSTVRASHSTHPSVPGRFCGLWPPSFALRRADRLQRAAPRDLPERADSADHPLALLPASLPSSRP